MLVALAACAPFIPGMQATPAPVSFGKNYMKFLIALAFALVSAAVFASCPEHNFTDPSNVLLNGDSVLIVTHASANYDARFSSKRGLDEATGFAKRKGIPIIYLQDDSPNRDYFMGECDPAYWVFSEGGELSFEVRPSHVYVAGGHLEKCLSVTVHDILNSWARQPMRNLTLTYLMDGIYSNGKLVEESDAFYGDFEVFMRTITYGRPGGEHWPKLNLLETMGIINKEEHELEFLKKALPHYEKTLPPGYRVELQLNDSVVKVLQSAPGWHPPTLKFHFVDSALKLDEFNPAKQ
jgi:hypothetical protein